MAEKIPTAIKRLSKRQHVHTCRPACCKLGYLILHHNHEFELRHSCQGKPIKNAVEKVVSHALDTGARASLLTLSHCGTWQGQLQIIATDTAADFVDNSRIL